MTARPLLVGLGWLDRPGGLERYLADLRRRLDEPATVVLATGPTDDPTLHVAASPDDSVPKRLLGVRRAVARLAPRAEVLDLHFALTGAGALLARSGRRLPRVVHFQGPWADEGPQRGRRARRALERLVYRRAERFVVLSGSMARVLVERYGADPWRIDVIPPGVDLAQFSPGDRAGARESLGFPADAFLVVAVRRLVERTGIAVLLDAWDQAADDLPAGARLLVAGDGPSRPALDEQLAALAPRRPAQLVGAVDEATLVALYRSADLVVVPSVRLEGFGLVALEALACGAPVLATDCGGLPDAVAGLGPDLVPPGDRAALADALVGASRGPLPSRQACRRHAERFDWDTVAARHRELYDLVAARRPAQTRRVVVLDHSAASSGGEIAMARLVDALPGTTVHAVLFDEGPFVARLARAGATVEVRRLGAPGAVDRQAATRALTVARHGAAVAWHTVRLAVRLRRLQPDVVHANSLKSGLIGGVAARLARVPVVWHVRDRIAADYLPERAARLVRFAVRHLPDAVITPSHEVMATLGAPGRRDVERVVVPDPYAVGAAPVDRTGGSVVEVAMVGRIARWKGQDVFVRAFASAFPDGSAQATIVGAPVFGGDDDRYAAELEALVASLDPATSVTLAGARDDVASVVGRADIVVHASRSPEPFGQVVVEAMAAGAAVVATAAGGPGELVRDGVDGILVPPDDVPALAAALRRLAADPAERHRLGRSARQRVAAVTDPERVGAAVAAVHARAARRRR